MAIASLRGLTYWYPGSARPALDACAFDLEGGLVLVSGPSGGGKSTLLRLLNGLVPHFHGGRIRGAATVLGHDVVTTPTATLARSVGFVFQDPERQFVHGSVEREVAFGLESLGVPAAAMAGLVEVALDAVGAGHLRERRVATLSGGERQRAAIASALAAGPRLLVLDEPTSQLDAEGARAVADVLVRLRGLGHDLVIAEHRLDLVLPLADRVVVVESGRPRVVDPSEVRPPAPGPRSERPAAGPPVWRLRNVSAGPTRTPVLEGVELEGRAGEVVALRGPNGGGKTTLLRTLAGLLAPLEGRVEREPGRVAYLPQDPAALLHLATVRAEVELTLRRAGEPVTPDEVLDRLGLLEVAERDPRDLSSGERQRAALAAVLAGGPRVALLDEPTRGMDAQSRSRLAGLVGAMAAGGTAVVVATHDDRLAAEVADRVVEVGGGGVREVVAE